MSDSTTKYRLPLFDDYLLHMQSSNYSSETIYNYERDLKVLEVFLSDIKSEFSNLTKKNILEYKAYLSSIDRKTAGKSKSKKKLQSRSLNRYLSVLRSYLKFLIEMDYDSPLPPEAVKLVKMERKHPQVAELEDLIRLIESPTQLESNKLIAKRNRAILEILFSTGMRISEVVNLKRSQIDGSGKIFILGKGKKERFVYLTPRATQHLNTYLQERKDSYPALFIPMRGSNTKPTVTMTRRISTNYLQERIKEYREKLKINVPTSAHSLRHGFATYLAEQGANPAALQILLGHESLDTTTRYVHASDRYAERTHSKYHPAKKAE